MSDLEHARLLYRLARDNLYDDLDPADVTYDFREVIDQVADLLGHVDRLVNSRP